MNEARHYLDETGVALLWAKIKLAIAAKPDVNTTYTLSQDSTDGHKFTLTGSDGYSATITIPDNGEDNVIDSISVNGSALTPSASKNVDITVPTKVSDITNDSNFQTDAQVVAAINQLLSIVSISVNGTTLTPSAEKNVNITVPTKVSDITNDSNFQTDTQVTNAINEAISGITSIDFVTVASYADLPTTGTKGVIYLVPHTASEHDVYDEYIWTKVSGDTYGYEHIGSTAVDLSDYMKISDWNSDVYMTPITSTEIDEICT